MFIYADCTAPPCFCRPARRRHAECARCAHCLARRAGMRPLSARSSTGPAAHAATLPPPTARPALRLLAFSLPLRSLRLGPCTAAAAGGGAGGECFGLGPGAKHSSSGGLQDGRHRRRDRQAVGSEVIIPHCLSGLEPQPTPHTAPAAAALDRSTHPPVTASEPPKEEASASRASSLSHSASCAQLAPPLSLPPPSRLPLAACVGLPSRLAAVQRLADFGAASPVPGESGATLAAVGQEAGQGKT